jgi:hypothetical protein
MAAASSPSSPRVLVWNQYLPPDTSATATLAAQLLARLQVRGVDVTTLQGNPSYRPTERVRWRRCRLVQRDGFGNTMVRSTARGRDRLTDRALNYTTFAALSAVVALFTRCDVILVMTDPP